MTLTDELSTIVGDAFHAEGLDAAFGLVRVSDRPDLAQFQCNGALAAAKAQKKNPREIGAAVAARLEAAGLFEKVDLAGPGFINLTLTSNALSERTEILAGDETIGAYRAPSSEMIVVDYGGPNVAKPLHVGHLRSAIIGEALIGILRAAGHEVVGDIHLGDWGLQMGQVLSELELRSPDLDYFKSGFDGPFSDEPPITVKELEEIYPAASAACKADPARAEIARKATKDLQDGRPGYRALWRHLVDLSITDMKKNYGDIGVHFDLWKGEADADPLIPEIVEDLTSKGLVEIDDGAQIIRVAREVDKKEVPPVILVNSQGAVGYHATDIATILDRARSFDVDRMLYVVDNRQALHFEQVYRVSDAADYFSEDKLEHLGFGTMNGKDGKPYKTREGGVLKLRDLIDQVTDKARERLTESGLAASYGSDEAAEIARKVGVAALKFADLSNPRTTDYIFDLDRFMTFEGKTGPYLLYARVRMNSVLEKAMAKGGKIGVVVIGAKEEEALALTLLNFSDAMRSAIEKRMPHILCDHAFAIAQAFSKFYAACRIADEEDVAIRSSRLALVKAAYRQLSSVLTMLGIPAPERM